MSGSAEVLAEAVEVIRAVTGIDFTHYRPAALLAALARHLGTDPPDRWLRLLRADPQRARALADDFLVTVTGFFRDSDVFDTIARRVVPALLEGGRSAQTVRAWCVGCATGEETYSLAMTLLDALDAEGRSHGVQVFATDIHAPSLAIARAGVYRDAAAAVVGAERLARFFEPVPGGYRAGERLRASITFAHHDVTAEAPFTHVDLITCRNVLMYFGRALQEQVAEVLHCALTRDGFLVLGRSESLVVPEFTRVAANPALYRNGSERAARLPVLRRRIDPPRVPPRMAPDVVESRTLQREELICAHEQLRAMTEELRVAKQELASVHMELRLVGEESQERLEALHDQARDVEELLDIAGVAMLFLDRESRILRFTPGARDLFHVRATDRGRPISDLVHRLAGGALDQIRGACATCTDLEIEVADTAGRRYLMRAQGAPPRGSTITFVDITPARRRDVVQSLYRMSPDWQLMRQLDGRGLLTDTVEARHGWMDTYIDAADRALVWDAIEHAIAARSEFDLTHRVVTVNGGLVWIRSRALPIFDTSGQVREWFGVASSSPPPEGVP